MRREWDVTCEMDSDGCAKAKRAEECGPKSDWEEVASERRVANVGEAKVGAVNE